jgi:hypothetical protein
MNMRSTSKRWTPKLLAARGARIRALASAAESCARAARAAASGAVHAMNAPRFGAANRALVVAVALTAALSFATTSAHAQNAATKPAQSKAAPNPQDLDPAVDTTKSPPPSALEPTVDTSKAPPPSVLEPAVDTSAAAPNDAAAPSANNAKGSGDKARTGARSGGGKAMDRLELDTTSITGNRELPKVLYIVPWKRADLGDLLGKPVNSLLDEVLTPVDRDVFKRENRYFTALDQSAAAQSANGAGSPVAAPGTGAQTPPPAPAK